MTNCVLALSWLARMYKYARQLTGRRYYNNTNTNTSTHALHNKTPFRARRLAKYNMHVAIVVVNTFEWTHAHVHIHTHFR